MDVMVVVLNVFMNLFIKITLLMRLVLLTKLMAGDKDLDVLQKLNVKIVSLKKAVGLKKELKSMEFRNMDKS